MLDWFKKIGKDYPDFWMEYISKFEEKSNRYVALTVETSGINPKKNVLLSFAAVGIVDQNIIVNDYFEFSMNDFETEADAIQKFIEYIGNATLVGHRIYLDVEMINEALSKMDCGRIKNEALDIEIMHKKLFDIHEDKPMSLSEIVSHYKIIQADKSSNADDAFTIALLFLKLKSQLRLK